LVKLGKINPDRVCTYAPIGIENTETGKRLHIDEFTALRAADFNEEADTSSKPSGENGTPSHGLKMERLTLDASSWAVTFDGKEFKIGSPRAFKIFKMIADANGDIVASEAIKRRVAGLERGSRIGQILTKRVPKELRRLITGQRGTNSGFSLKLPPKEDAQ